MLSWAIKSNLFITLAKTTVFARTKVLGIVYFILGSCHDKVYI